MSNVDRIWTAALVVIGDEILSGRTHDRNIAQIASWLQVQGIRLAEVRVVADLEDAIIGAVDTLRAQAPDLATAMTDTEADSFLLTSRLRLTPFYRPVAPALLLPAEQFSRRIADAAHSSGVSVFVVSSGDSAAQRRLIDQGADGIVTQ